MMWRNAAACLLVSSLFSACDGENHPIGWGQPLDASPAAASRIVPQTIVLTPVTGVHCPFLTPFTSTFDVVINPGSRDLFLDQVTLRLSDGSSVGGSPVLMSSADLTARLASTRIRAGTTNRFELSPRFGCGGFLPRAMHADIVLRDGSGVMHTTSLVVPIG